MTTDDRKPDDDLATRRDRLSQELAKRVSDPAERGRKTSAWGEATKIASEFVAGVVVGVGLGLIFDRVFGTSPFGLIVCLLLGFAAGVLNVLRAQGRISDAGAQLRSTAPDRDPRGGAGPADKNSG